MFEPKYRNTQAIIESLIQIEAFKKYIMRIPLLPSWEEILRREAVVESVHHTTRIEGNTLTLDETRAVLLEGKRFPQKARDVREVQNARVVAEFIASHAGETPGPPLTEEVIKRIQHLTVEGLGDTRAGEYRRGCVAVINSATGEVLYQPPEATEAPRLMKEFVAWLNHPATRTIAPPIVAVIAHYQLVTIHPFEDGNGRTARALESLILYRHGYAIRQLYSLANFYDRHRPEYYARLREVQHAEGDLTPHIEFALGGLVQELQAVEEKLLDRYRRVLYVEAAVEQGCNPRQIGLVRMLAERGAVPFADYRRAHPKVAERTLRQDVQFLLRWQLILEEGTKRNRILRPAMTWTSLSPT